MRKAQKNASKLLSELQARQGDFLRLAPLSLLALYIQKHHISMANVNYDNEIYVLLRGQSYW